MQTPNTRLQKVADAYNRRATEYSTVLGHIDGTSPKDQEQIQTWARAVSGSICDLGCGPGHWTNFLHTNAVSVCGFDPGREFINIARSNFPHLLFTQGTAKDLPAQIFDGILAWYSLIHTHPEELHYELRSIARALKPGGHLLIGFFTDDDVKPFDHSITEAWFYPLKEMEKRLTKAGFTPITSYTRHDAGARPHGSIEAVLTAR